MNVMFRLALSSAVAFRRWNHQRIQSENERLRLADQNAAGGAIVNPGLRGIVFGQAGCANTLYFTSGITGEPSLFGSISSAPVKLAK
jgi:hypothetical protein